jgi:hypothetical protein
MRPFDKEKNSYAVSGLRLLVQSDIKRLDETLEDIADAGSAASKDLKDPLRDVYRQVRDAKRLLQAAEAELATISTKQLGSSLASLLDTLNKKK